MTLLLYISGITLLSIAAAEQCWWTGCQPHNWAVVGCAQYSMIENAREKCTDGNKYECCPGDPVTSVAPVTADPAEASCSEGYWTGCQSNSWAVVGCEHLNMTTKAKKPCDGGNLYHCCPRTEGDDDNVDVKEGEKSSATDSEVWEELVTEDPLSCAGGYWTGCQSNTWAVVGCKHLNMTTRAKKACDGGYLYHCCPRTGDEPPPIEEPLSASSIDPATNMSYLNLVKYLLSKNEEFANPEYLSCTDVDPQKVFQLRLGDYAIPVCNLCPKFKQLIYVNKMLKQDPVWESEGIDFQLCFGSCVEKVSCVAFSHDNTTRSCYHFASSRAGMASVAGFNTVIMTQPTGIVGPWMYSRNTKITGASNYSVTVPSFQDCIGKAETSDSPHIVAVSYSFSLKQCKLFSKSQSHVANLEAGHATAMRLSSIIPDSDLESRFESDDEIELIERIKAYGLLLGTCNFTDEAKPYIGAYHRPQCRLNPLQGCIEGSSCKKCYFPEKLRKGDDAEELEVCPDSFRSKYDKVMEKINKQLRECASTVDCIAVIYDEFFNPTLIKPSNVQVVTEKSIVYLARFPKLSGTDLQLENFKLLLSYKLQKSPVQSDDEFTIRRADNLGKCVESCNKMTKCERLSFNDETKSCAMSTADALLSPVETKGSRDVIAVKSKDASFTGTRYIFLPASVIDDENAGKFLLEKQDCRSSCVSFCQTQCNAKEACQLATLTLSGSSYSCSLYSSGNLTTAVNGQSMIFRKDGRIEITEQSLNEMPMFSSSDAFGCYRDSGATARQTENSLSFVTEEVAHDENKVRAKRGFWDGVKGFFKGVGDGIVNAGKGLVEGVKSAGKAVGNLVTGKPEEALKELKNVPIIGDAVKVGEGVGKLIQGDKDGALESFADTTVGNTINAAKDVGEGLIKGDFEGAAEKAGGLAVDLVGGRVGLKGVKGGKGGKGGKKNTVDKDIKNEKNKGDRKKRSADDDNNSKQEKDQKRERRKQCKAKRRPKRATAKQRKTSPTSSTNAADDDCDDDDDYCPPLKGDNIITEGKSVFPCSRTKVYRSCNFECMPGFKEEPEYKLKCVKGQGDVLKWEKTNIRCEQEQCPVSGKIVLSTPHPTSFNERRLTAMVIKFDKSRKIPSWSVGMFQSEEFGLRDYTHLAQKDSAGRHGSFLKHHCSYLKHSQANDRAYTGEKWERGHLTPAQAVRWSPKASRSVNLYINVAPQDKNVNKLIWKFIESHTYCFSKKTRTIVATGTCSRSIASMNGVDVPSCFWKLICFRDEKDEHQVVGFIADNNDLPNADLKRRKKLAFTPKSQAEVLAHAGIAVTPFATAAADIIRGREVLAIAPGLDAVDTANPVSCATAMKLPKEIFDEWDNAMDPDEKKSATSALKRKIAPLASSSSNKRGKRAIGKRNCKPCNADELKGTIGALIASANRAKEEDEEDDEEIGSTDSTVVSSKCGKRVVGYYPSWGTRKFSPRMAQKLTHVIYAFFETTAAGDVKIGCVDPAHTSNCDDDADTARSRLKQMLSVASHFGHLNVMFAVGGWENSQYFSEIAASKEKRLVFIAAIIKAIQEYDFDGVDVDWEYPVTGGAKEGVPSDKQNYVILLSELRAALDNYSKMKGRTKPLLLSIAGAAGQWTLDPGYDMKNVIKYLDFVNVMTYDFFGAWESKWGAYTGPPAPLYFGMPKGFSGKTNVAWTIKYYACRGRQPHKINMGLPFYGRYWENVGDAVDPSDQMWRKAEAVGGKFVGGAMKYPEVLGNISQPGFEQHFHEKTKSKYAFNPSSKMYIGFDDKETLGHKISFAQEKNVGGLMIWAIDQDDDDLSLLDLVANADLCGNTNPDDINFKCLPTDEILWWIPENSDENTQGKCGPSAPPIHGRSPVCDPDDPGYSCCSKSGYCGSGDEFCKCDGCIDHGAEPDKILERSKVAG